MAEWKEALPLLRLGGERIYSPTRLDVVVPHMFAGSILDLEPDTAYEARFVMADADGVAGPATKTMTGRNRCRSRVGVSFMSIPTASTVRRSSLPTRD